MAESINTAPPESGATEPKSEQSFGRWLLETALLVGLAFVLAQGIKTFIVQPFVIPTGSMIPTIELQDRLLAEKITYRFVRPPQPGEIVVFDNPDSNDPVAKILIKRVIATEGQTVDIRDGAVYVDGQKLDEPYVYDKPTELGTVAMPIEIPQGHVWLMGDNRPNSGDSRFFGPVPVESVNGRAFWTYWPLSSFGGLD